MNLCLPYTHFMNDLFRCLFSDLQLEHTEAPFPGKYTREIGQTFADGTLCAGLQCVLGSLAECCYLGADTAVVFAPCGECSAARIKAKMENCFVANGIRLRLIILEPSYASQKAFWQQLGAQSTLSVPRFLEAKRRFYACGELLNTFAAQRYALQSSVQGRQYLEGIEKELRRATDLLQLKLLLSLYTKRLAALPQSAVSVPLQAQLPYEQGDYFDLCNTPRSACEFFVRRKREKTPLVSAREPVQKCCRKGDTSAILLKG